MASPKGKQFWKLRTKHARDKLFASPQLVLEASFEYFDWVDKHPLYKHEAIKSGVGFGTTFKVPIERPYTLSGLCLYLGCSSAYFKALTSSTDQDLLTVLEQIELIIETQQFEGATVGAFNANIIVRKLALREQTDITSNGQDLHIQVIDEETKQQIGELKKRLSD